MKRAAAISKKDLTAAGFVEFATDRFAPANHIDAANFQPADVSQIQPKKRKSIKTPSKKIDLFIILIQQELNIIPIPEYKFTDSRKWRMDYAFPDHKIFIEVEGGVFTNGRHTRGKGFMNDMEKYNAAAALGWKLIRRVPANLISNETIQLIKQTIEK